MTDDPCAREWEIDPYREGRLGPKDSRSFERHLRACGSCRARMEADERLRELARALPVAEPDELAVRRVRTRVMRDFATGIAPRRSPRWLGIGVASTVVFAAAAATWGLVARPDGPPTATEGASASVAASPFTTASVTGSLPASEALAGDVVPSASARWSRTRVQGVERIELAEGVLAVHVRAQVLGERFLVGLPDGELEVRGTTFEVTVAGGATTHVSVEEGVVELRLRGQAPRSLRAAETWTAAEETHAPAPRTTPAPPTPIPSPLPGPSSSVAGTDGAAGYGAAMGLLRSGRHDEAAAAFHAFVQSQPRAAQAEDASFLEAVALARAGRSDAAALAAEHHLASFPGSFHRREAAILVARAAVQRGNCPRARAVLAAWTGDPPDAEAQATLRGCPAP